ncbi:MAG: hypothetical protein JW839_10135 [Candidatus Lokiarchaeota archaeon]|nr:hypothetical protein [Candidatus Lokiarchaeota archaeon]
MNTPAETTNAAAAITGEIHALTGTLVNLFRDKSKKEAIIAITGKHKKTLDNLIKGAAAYLIINQYHLEYPGGTPGEKAKNLYGELKTLFGDTIGESIKIQEKAMAFTTAVYELLLKTPTIKRAEKRRLVLSELEGDFIEVMRTVPEYYFFDFLEGLMDISAIARGAGRDDGGKDEGIKEIFSFSSFRKAIIGFLRIHRIRDLELVYRPIMKLAATAYEQTIEAMPLSRRGMEAFYKANGFRNEVIKIFKEANESGETPDEISKRIHENIHDRLRAAAGESANDVIYYLENLLGLSFEKIVELLKSYGILDITLVGTALTTDYTKLEYRFDEKGIEKGDIERLFKYEGAMTSFVQVSLDDFKRSQKSKGFSRERWEGITIQAMIQDHLSDVDNPALDFIANDLHLTKQELVDMLLLEVSVKDIIKDMNIKNMSTLLMIIKLQKFIKSITEEVFVSMLARLTKQLARIMEFFLLFNMVRKDMFDGIKARRRGPRLPPHDLMKFQEGFTGLIMQLQDSVAYLLNKNDPYDVNAFIHGKLCERTYEAALKDIKEGDSPLYFGVVKHPVVLDDLEIVSSISALDLFLRCVEKLR